MNMTIGAITMTMTTKTDNPLSLSTQSMPLMLLTTLSVEFHNLSIIITKPFNYFPQNQPISSTLMAMTTRIPLVPLGETTTPV